MTPFSPRRSAWIKIGLLAAALAAGSVICDRALGHLRLDLTEGHRYTLSPGCVKLLGNLQEPVDLTLYASTSAARGVPQLQTHMRRVDELLAQMKRASGGKLRVHKVDPVPYSDAEQRATEAGLTPVSLAGMRQFYLGLVATNSTDGREVMPFLPPDQDAFLEHDLAKTILKLARAKKPKIGLLTSLPVAGGPGSAPWEFYKDLSNLFEVTPVEAGANELPKDLDLLLVLHPRHYSEKLLTAVDAFAHAGKPVILGMDPFSFTEAAMQRQQQSPYMPQPAPPGPSDLGGLLKSWGVHFDPAQVAADRRYAVRQGAAGDAGARDFIAFLDLPPDTFNAKSPLLQNISRLRLPAAGVLSPEVNAGTHFEPLLTIHGGTLPVSAMNYPDPDQWRKMFDPDEREHVLAAYVTGPAPVYPPVKAAPPPTAKDKDGKKADATKAPAQAAPTPSGDLKVLVIADADFPNEMWWSAPVQMGGRTVGYQKEADNADFLLAAVDTLSAGGDLAAIASRGSYDRPFTYVDNLRKEAQAREQGQLTELENKRRDTERKIRQLRGGSVDANGEITLGPAQKKELEQYIKNYAATGESLRKRRFELNKDVAQLGTLITAANAAGAPLLVILGAISLAAWRRKRRRDA